MSVRSRHGHRLAALAGIAIVAIVGLMHVPDATLGLAFLGPAVLVFVLLGLGRYPGEARLVELSRPPHRRRASRAVRSSCRDLGAAMPRGGSLLAAALAGRAPPESRLLGIKLSTA